MAAAVAAAAVLPALTSSSPSPRLFFRKCHSAAITAASSSIPFPPRPATAALSLPSSTKFSLPVTSPVSSRRLISLISFAVPADDSRSSDAGSERGPDVPDAGGSLEEAWLKVLESFKANALRMKSVSQEAYEAYSRKVAVILRETSKELTIDADKANRDLDEMARQLGEEGWEYFSAASANSPEPVKDVIEVFTETPADFRDVSKVHDFHVGIPYGAFLAAGGFLSFMCTGSTAAIRFGIILGGTLLALSVFSLRKWKMGKSSFLLLNGQAAIAAILFLREGRLLLQRSSLQSSFVTIANASVLFFYMYKIRISLEGIRKTLDQDSETSDV